MSPAPALPGSLVLVTGVNGHVASLISYTLLSNGYRVRGTVRAIQRAAVVKESFAAFKDRFEVVEVPDISKKDAFRSAMESLSCPFNLPTDKVLRASIIQV